MSYYCKTITLREALEEVYPQFRLKTKLKAIEISGLDGSGEFIAKYLDFEDRYLINLRIFNNGKHSIVLCLFADLLIYRASTHKATGANIENSENEIMITAVIDSVDELERLLNTKVIVPFNFD